MLMLELGNQHGDACGLRNLYYLWVDVGHRPIDDAVRIGQGGLELAVQKINQETEPVDPLLEIVPFAPYRGHDVRLQELCFIPVLAAPPITVFSEHVLGL